MAREPNLDLLIKNHSPEELIYLVGIYRMIYCLLSDFEGGHELIAEVLGELKAIVESENDAESAMKKISTECKKTVDATLKGW